jgi:hypothetical protein
MKVITTIERLSVNRSLVDLGGAIAAGVCAGAATALGNALYHELNLVTYARWIFLAIAAYFTVASLLQRFWPNQLKRIVPVWLLTAFLGSILFVACNLIPEVIKGWYDPYKLERSLAEYISTELGAAKSVIMLLSLITIPVTATFHHAGHIIRGVKAWHGGPAPLSILDGAALRRRYRKRIAR